MKDETAYFVIAIGFLVFISCFVGIKIGKSIGHDSVCEQIKYENKWNVEEVRYCADFIQGVDKAGTK